MSDARFAWVEEFFPRIYYVLGGGTGDYFDMCRAFPPMAVARTPRSMANVIYDFSAQRAREVFADIPERVKIIEEYDTITLYFPERDAKMKIHKGDDERRIHPPNNTERSARDYYQPSLYEGQYDGPLVLNAVYQLNATATALGSVSVSYQAGEDIVWWKEVPPPDSDSGFSVVRPQTPPDTDSDDVGYATGSA